MLSADESQEDRINANDLSMMFQQKIGLRSSDEEDNGIPMMQVLDENYFESSFDHRANARSYASYDSQDS